MKHLKHITIVSLTLLLGACATSVPQVDFYDTDSASLRRFQTITVIDDAASAGLVKLEEITGLYCKGGFRYAEVTEPRARLEAIDQIRLKAAILGAQYIGEPACQARDRSDMVNNCYGTLVCTAPAFAERDSQ